jgi:hypothetical protein
MIPLCISAIYSLKSFRHNWPVPYKIFSLLLLYVLFLETFAFIWPYLRSLIRNWPYSKSNLWAYNIGLIPQYILYLAMYYYIAKSATARKWILMLGIPAILFIPVNFLFIQSIHIPNNFSFLFLQISMILLTVIYFEEIRKSNEIINLQTHPFTWIALGAFVFHLGDIPFMLGLNHLIIYDLSLANALLFLHVILNCVMYSLYTIAFLCNPPPQK